MSSYNSNNIGNQTRKNVKLGRRMNDKKTIDLFLNVIYVVDDLLPEFQKIRVK